jgi:hypothetical protein
MVLLNGFSDVDDMWWWDPYVCPSFFFSLPPTYLLQLGLGKILDIHLSVRNVVPTLTSSKRQGLSLEGRC